MGQLRFSIGLEDAEDIIAELDEALGRRSKRSIA